MTEESEPAIPYGIDVRTRRDVEISQAEPGRPHACPKCHELLDQRRGEIRRPYFAHHPGATDLSCPWRTSEGIQHSLQESEDAAIAGGRRIRLFLRRRPGTSEARLFGLIPPMTTADVAIAKKSISPPQILTLGSTRPVGFSDLLPASSSGWIALDPQAQQYRVDIRPSQLSNAGVWTADRVVGGYLFVGNESEAELVASPRHITAGQWVYRVASENDKPVAGTQRLRLGSLEVLAVEASTEHAPIISSWTAGIALDQPFLRIDLVLPLEQSPWAAEQGVIHAAPTKRILLAVTPPPGQDPGLYVYQFPFNDAGRLELSRSGAGKPRFIETTVSEGGASRLLIHWPLFQDRDVLLDLVAATEKESQAEQAALPSIGLEITSPHGVAEFLEPLDSPDGVLEGHVDANHVATLGPVSLRSPSGFAVRLRAEYAQFGTGEAWQDEGLAVGSELREKLRDSFERGAKRIQAHFGTLGVVTLRCPGIVEELDKIRNAELDRERVHVEESNRLAEEASHRARRSAMEKQIAGAFRNLRGTIPRHVSFAWIREFLNLPPETVSEQLVDYRYLIKRMGKDAGIYRVAHQATPEFQQPQTPPDNP